MDFALYFQNVIWPGGAGWGLNLLPKKNLKKPNTPKYAQVLVVTWAKPNSVTTDQKDLITHPVPDIFVADVTTLSAPVLPPGPVSDTLKLGAVKFQSHVLRPIVYGL